MKFCGHNNLQRLVASLSLLLCVLHADSLLAAVYTSPPTTAPFPLANGDSLTVASGTMATPSGNNTAYSVDFGGSTAKAVTININNGATLSYLGANGSAASINSLHTDANSGTTNINILGSLNAGNGLYAISFRNNNASPADIYNINIGTTGSITGTILTNSVSHAVVNITGTPTINGALSLGTSSLGSSLLVVGASGTATFTPTFSISDVTTIQLSNSSTLNLGVATADIFAVNIDSGSTLNLTETLNGVNPPDGNIINNGTFNIAADIAKTGGFTGIGTNVITAGGSTGLNIDTFNYTVRNHIAALQNVSEYGNITLTDANFALAAPSTLKIAYGYNDGYAPGYFPGGTYTLVSTLDGSVTMPSTITMPSDTPYLTFGTPFVNSATDKIQITLTRTPFTSYVSENLTLQIAGTLEAIGNNNPSSTMVSLLSAVEQNTTSQTLQDSLQQLAPLTTAPVYGYQIQNDTMRQAKLRLAEVRNGLQSTYIAGDVGRDKHLWLRPFGIYANQGAKDDSLGYYATSGGIVGGFDRDLDDRYTLGAGFAYVTSNVKDKVNVQSVTDIKSYIALVYGSYNFTELSYLDWVLSFTANNFEGSRIVSFNTFNQTAVSEYSSQQGSIYGLLGHDYEAFGFMQLTTEAFAQYTFTKQYPYTEDGAFAANLLIDRQNSDVVTLGLGGKAGIPFLADPSIVVPDIHGMFYYNPIVGVQNTNFTFTEGGGPMISSFGLSRTGLTIGAALTIAVLDNVEVKFNFDYEVEDRYNGYSGYLNIRYIF